MTTTGSSERREGRLSAALRLVLRRYWAQEALWNLLEGRTAIVIAHRLSTVRRMDELIILDRGRIVERGSHEQLLARGGIYASLWARQSGGFLHEDEPLAAAGAGP